MTKCDVISGSVGAEISETLPRNHGTEYVTGSTKTGHNRSSLNLQYKALNTLCAYLCIVEKNSVNFLNVSFLVKEGCKVKEGCYKDIIFFTCSISSSKIFVSLK